MSNSYLIGSLWSLSAILLCSKPNNGCAIIICTYNEQTMHIWYTVQHVPVAAALSCVDAIVAPLVDDGDDSSHGPAALVNRLVSSVSSRDDNDRSLYDHQSTCGMLAPYVVASWDTWHMYYLACVLYRSHDDNAFTSKSTFNSPWSCDDNDGLVDDDNGSRGVNWCNVNNSSRSSTIKYSVPSLSLRDIIRWNDVTIGGHIPAYITSISYHIILMAIMGIICTFSSDLYTNGSASAANDARGTRMRRDDDSFTMDDYITYASVSNTTYDMMYVWVWSFIVNLSE